MFRFSFIVATICISFSSHLIANQNFNDKNRYSQSAYGGIGLIEMPTARFSNDGEFLFGVSSEDPYNRLFAKMQFFPWLEAVVRYTEGTYEPYNEGSHQTWKDKGIDLRFKLFEEGELIPQLALGLTDLGGTGAYSGEYIVVSKAFNNNLDVTLGLGWGRFGGIDHFDNIIGWLDNERNVRGGYSTYGGKINLKRFFSGERTSVFGGIEYFTPLPNLSFKVEYDTSFYSNIIGKEKQFDETGDPFILDSRLNYAFNYRLNLGERDKIDLSLGYIRGNTIYANLSVHSNLNYSGTPKIIMGGEKLKESNIESYKILNNDWQKYITDTIMWEMGNAGFITHNIIFNEKELMAEISQSRFLKTTQAFDLALRILANNAPKNIETITIVNIDQGLETVRASINKNLLRKAVLVGGLPEKFIEFNNKELISSNAVIIENDYLYPNFYWNIRPHALGTIQHQEKFYFYQLEALLHTEYSIKKGLYLMADIGINVFNNFDDYTYHIPDGELHHVRQDRRLYLTEGESGLRRMAIDYTVDLHSNIKAKVSAGYLEWMYGGFGGEIIYMPDDKRWALGIDTYWVKQRDFDQKLSFQDYETVTGFLTYYRDIPFYDMRLKVSAGKFLGTDKGVQIDISRRFNSGARVGGIVSLTDCDADCVGEGSFSKWIYFELPMNLFYVQSTTRNKTGYAWSPLTKDAGVKVEPGGLYDLMINATDETDILRQKSWSLRKIFSGFSTQPNNRS